MSTVPDRSEIDTDYQWDLSTIFTSADEWERAYEEARGDIDTLAAYDADAIDGPEALYEVLSLRDTVDRRVETIAAYARMRRDEDLRDQTAQALYTRAQSLQSEAASAASFIEPAIQRYDAETIDAFIETVPELAEYEQYLDDVLRMKPHTRAPAVESVLAELSEVTNAASDVYQSLANADLEFPSVTDPDGEPVEISLANFTTLQKHPDRDFRQRVYEQFYDRWGEYRTTVGTAFQKSVTRDVTTAEIRGYESSKAAALDAANVPPVVYDTLLETVRAQSDVLDRHARLKRQALGVDTLRMWDLYMPVARDDGPTIEYDTAREHVVAALKPLGEDYQTRVATGLDSRWVDVYENRGKRSGAYSGGTYDTQPFILMNYQDDVSSMYTLAHELGHSIHSELASEHQSYIDSSYEIFVAEVASTVNEVLLTHHLLETVEDDVLRRHVLNEYLEKFRSTLFRQSMFAAFEDQVHAAAEAGEALTPDRIDEIYRDLKAEFYPSAAVDERIAREWMRIPHFYRAFYVYQYSTGISAAVDIATAILDGEDDRRQAYLTALSRGGSEYPVSILETAGVDVTAGDYIEATLEEYDTALDRMASLL